MLGNKYMLWLDRNRWCSVMNVLDKCQLGLVGCDPCVAHSLPSIKLFIFLFLEYISTCVLFFPLPLLILHTFERSVDETFDQHFDQTFENLFNDYGDQKDERKTSIPMTI